MEGMLSWQPRGAIHGPERTPRRGQDLQRALGRQGYPDRGWGCLSSELGY